MVRLVKIFRSGYLCIELCRNQTTKTLLRINRVGFTLYSFLQSNLIRLVRRGVSHSGRVEVGLTSDAIFEIGYNSTGL